uniref:Uncharacterized protein n=1 Tax=Anguilla anguilla TaxID=7936 RepID=A0A0E9U1A5_ANGAN
MMWQGLPKHIAYEESSVCHPPCLVLRLLSPVK